MRPGRNYVSLGDWAEANDFKVRWLRGGQGAELSNRSSRLVFGQDSHDLRQAQINGVNVVLSFPVMLHNASAEIARLDLDTVVKPVLQPPHERGGPRIRNIVLDPGHGGRDPGNQDGPRQEKMYTLLLAQELQSQLQQAGFKVSLTRSSDTLIDLPERPEIARRRGADMFISLHWNAVDSSKSEVKGAEVYCLTPAGAPSSNTSGELGDASTKPGNLLDDKNMFLAYTIQKSLAKNLSLEDRGVHHARFAVLRTAVMPAVLIEGGYMSHPSESKRIYDSAWRKQMAKAIVEGVLAYRTQVEPPIRR